eukprot:4161381-Prymnesium_polylepis.1
MIASSEPAFRRADCFQNRFKAVAFTPDGEWGGEAVDWAACKLSNPPKFWWEQLQCDGLVEPSPAARRAIAAVGTSGRSARGIGKAKCRERKTSFDESPVTHLAHLTAYQAPA